MAIRYVVAALLALLTAHAVPSQRVLTTVEIVCIAKEEQQARLETRRIFRYVQIRLQPSVPYVSRLVPEPSATALFQLPPPSRASFRFA